MLEFIKDNLATILISVGLLAVITLIIARLIINRKKGKSSCGCGCEACPMSDSCHKKE